MHFGNIIKLANHAHCIRKRRIVKKLFPAQRFVRHLLYYSLFCNIKNNKRDKLLKDLLQWQNEMNAPVPVQANPHYAEK